MKLKTLTLSLSLALFTAYSSAKSTSSSNSLLAQLPKALDGMLDHNYNDANDLLNRAKNVYKSTKAGQKARYESAYVIAKLMEASVLDDFDSYVQKNEKIPTEKLNQMNHLLKGGEILLKEACNNGKGLKKACKELKK